MDGIPQSGSYTLSQHVFQIFPTVILRCVTPQKAGDSMNIGIVGAGKSAFPSADCLPKKACGYPAITAAIPTAQEKPQNLQIPDTIPPWANSSMIVTRFSSPFRIMRLPRYIGRSQNLNSGQVYMSLQRRLHSRGSLSRYSRAGSLCNIHSSAISDQQQV